MAPPGVKRPSTIADRDEYRPKTPPKGLTMYQPVESAAPREVIDEDSTAYDIPERQAKRERRPTPNRIRKLEAFKDDVLERLPKLEGNVQFLVDEKLEEKKRRDERRAWWRAAGLIAVKGVFSSSVILAVLHAVGVL